MSKQTMKLSISKEQKFYLNIKKKLPKDLELHNVSDTYESWEIRLKGFYFNFWRPSVNVNYLSKEFRVYYVKDIELAKRLSEIFPEMMVTSNNLDVLSRCEK